jgi:hypothetical protein
MITFESVFLSAIAGTVTTAKDATDAVVMATEVAEVAMGTKAVLNNAKRVDFWIGVDVKVTYPDDGCGELVRYGVIHSHRNGVYLIADADGDALCLATLDEMTRRDYQAPTPADAERVCALCGGPASCTPESCGARDL